MLRHTSAPASLAGRLSRAQSMASGPSALSNTSPLRSRKQSASSSLSSHALSVASWQSMRLQRCMMRSGPASVACAAAAAAAPAATPAVEVDLSSAVDIRVGRIAKVERHPEADALYISQIEVGEAEPRQIVSGLVKFVPIESMQDRRVIVICNLKARNLKGVKSNGMVLCASDAAHENVEPLVPPEGAAVGERVWFGEGNQTQPAPAEPNRVQKKKIWEAFQPDLKTDAGQVAGYKGRPMLTSGGQVLAPTLAAASIS